MTTTNNNFIGETDFWKWLTASLGSILAGITVVFTKTSFNFLKEKNKQFNQLKTRLDTLESSVDKINGVIFYVDDRGVNTDIIKQIRIIKHQLKNQDASEAGAFTLILDKLKSLDDHMNDKIEGLNKKIGELDEHINKK